MDANAIIEKIKEIATSKGHGVVLTCRIINDMEIIQGLITFPNNAKYRHFGMILEYSKHLITEDVVIKEYERWTK